ncbi:Transcriptional regulatory protein DegU [Roseibaca ekhonensis]|jgi:DNA-binding NarL/FixJ family response regulator|uniref:Transcriptional regulatory protein DegU n=1 Tax=Roseinatronobacter ekhonensis TaxID=254356 RepID=A0A3B0M307_9RHOB|nr:response regulator transcription factor [Roseibaca ekhonensis]SUZ30532.1 Transcriptional regulatory protein DegU [Roseibaca ekhonensis]
MRLLIADDHELLRDTLRSFLQQQDGLEICTVGDLDGALELLDAGESYDLILLDYTMPGMNGLDGLRHLLDRPDTGPVALISGIAETEVALQAVQMGAQGFLQKTMPAQSLLNAIRFMTLGERFVPVELILSHISDPVQPQKPVTDRPDVTLTPRETEVLAALCRGQTNKEIARALSLSEPTIKLHVKTLYRRLGATNRTQAAMIARNMGLS